VPKLNRGDLHATYRWRNSVSPLARALNPVCQWVNPADGKQCTKPSEVVHHLIDPKDAPEKFFDWSNLVCTCADHHQGGQRGETQGYIYCHTVGVADAIYFHHCYPIWHKNYKPPVGSHSEQTLLPLGSTASAVGDDALNAALAAD